MGFHEDGSAAIGIKYSLAPLAFDRVQVPTRNKVESRRLVVKCIIQEQNCVWCVSYSVGFAYFWSSRACFSQYYTASLFTPSPPRRVPS